MKREIRRIMGLSAVAALSLASCGESEEDKARSVALLMAKRDPAVCDSMTRAYYEHGPKACKQVLSGIGASKTAAVKKLTIRGSTATAVASRDEGPIVIELVRKDGKWKIADAAQLADIREARESTPRIQKGLDPRATVDAYLQAIDDEDGAAFCGLLTERYATKVLGGGERPDPIGDCVKDLRKFDWTDAHRTARGVKTAKVVRSGDTTAVMLTSGKRALLEQVEGRWVIDDIKG